MVFLFNVGGYYMMFWALRLQTDRKLGYRLDANLYHPEETIELKIPVALPYPIHSEDFQRVDGRFEHRGEFFKLVKQKLQNDTLYVVCIRDHATRNLVNAMNDYVQLTQGLPGEDNTPDALHYLSKLMKDLYSEGAVALRQRPGCTMAVQFPEQSDLFLQIVLPVQAPPPRS